MADKLRCRVSDARRQAVVLPCLCKLDSEASRTSAAHMTCMHWSLGSRFVARAHSQGRKRWRVLQGHLTNAFNVRLQQRRPMKKLCLAQPIRCEWYPMKCEWGRKGTDGIGRPQYAGCGGACKRVECQENFSISDFSHPQEARTQLPYACMCRSYQAARYSVERVALVTSHGESWQRASSSKKQEPQTASPVAAFCCLLYTPSSTLEWTTLCSSTRPLRWVSSWEWLTSAETKPWRRGVGVQLYVNRSDQKKESWKAQFDLTATTEHLWNDQKARAVFRAPFSVVLATRNTVSELETVLAAQPRSHCEARIFLAAPVKKKKKIHAWPSTTCIATCLPHCHRDTRPLPLFLPRRSTAKLDTRLCSSVLV